MAPIATICLIVTVATLLCSTTCVSGQGIKCNTGFTGKLCEIECALCKNEICSFEGCFLGCINGYFSKKRSSPCRKCQSNCASCISWLNCTSCVAGFHGKSCESRCKRFCHKLSCDQTTGECTHGCADRYYKHKRTCSKCGKCSSCRTSECKSSCCGKTIRPACTVDRCLTCKMDNPKFCDECNTGYYVTNYGKCELCSSRCKHKTCNQQNGACIYGCIDGWEGLRCKKGSCANNSCDPQDMYQDGSGDEDGPRKTSLVIGTGVGSVIFVVVVVVITTFALVRRKKRAKEKTSSRILTEADVTDVSTYNDIKTSSSTSRPVLGTTNHNTEMHVLSGNYEYIEFDNEPEATEASTDHGIAPGSNSRSVVETTGQNKQRKTLPGTYQYVDVDNIDGKINNYESRGKCDQHLNPKNSYEALGARGDEHLYYTSKSSYEEPRPHGEYKHGKVGEPTYVNTTGVERF